MKNKNIKNKLFMGFKLDKNGYYNGHPPSYWIAMADQIVIETIVRGITENNRSVVQTIASERLKNLAMALNPDLYKNTIAERDACRSNLPRIVSAILGR